MAHPLLKIVSEWKKFRQFGSDLLLHDLVKRIYVSTMEFVTKGSCFSVSNHTFKEIVLYTSGGC